MNKWMIGVVMAAVVASGCTKKDDNIVASPTTSGTLQPSTVASATPKGTNAGGAVTATPQASGNTGTATSAPISTITKEQVEAISMTSTYDDLVKQTGSKGQLVNEENGKQTYRFAISNQAGYFAEFVYSADGKISEKRVVTK